MTRLRFILSTALLTVLLAAACIFVAAGGVSGLIGWIRSWWITWRVWRNADAEQWAILTGPHNPDDFVDAPRPS